MPNNLRIVHIVNFFDPRLGYLEYYLAKKQQKRGHEVYVVTSDRLLSANKRKVGLFDEEGVKVYHLSSLFEYSDNVVVPINSVKTTLSEISPKIIHLHDALSLISSIALRYKNSIGCKIVGDVITGKVTAEGLSLAIKTSILKIYRMTFLHPLLNKVDCFFANSEAALEWMEKNLSIPRSRTCLIPLGADSNLFRYNAHERNRIRKQLGVSSQDILAIYTGKLLPRKKIDTFLFAAAPFLKQRKDFKILIVGQGPSDYVNHLKEIINNLGLNSSVIFHGMVHRTELPGFYSTVDFAVWPGHHSISTIEAMSTGLPVIIPRSKWTNHLLENENGFDYIEGDVKELRSCIQSLVENDDLRRKMGENSRKLVEEKLNWDSIATMYLDAYEKVNRAK